MTASVERSPACRISSTWASSKRCSAASGTRVPLRGRWVSAMTPMWCAALTLEATGVDHEPAVNEERRARNVAGLIGGQPGDGAGDVRRLANAPQRNLAEQCLLL